MIEEKDYEKFKEMYDYKRKIEYNKEKIKKRIDKMYDEFEFNIIIMDSRHIAKSLKLANIPAQSIPKAQV